MTPQEALPHFYACDGARRFDPLHETANAAARAADDLKFSRLGVRINLDFMEITDVIILERELAVLGNMEPLAERIPALPKVIERLERHIHAMETHAADPKIGADAPTHMESARPLFQKLEEALATFKAAQQALTPLLFSVVACTERLVSHGREFVDGHFEHPLSLRDRLFFAPDSEEREELTRELLSVLWAMLSREECLRDDAVMRKVVSELEAQLMLEQALVI